MTEKYGSSIPESFAPFADVSVTKIHDALHKNNTKIQGVKMDAFSYSETSACRIWLEMEFLVAQCLLLKMEDHLVPNCLT